jgi:spermidine synthase
MSGKKKTHPEKAPLKKAAPVNHLLPWLFAGTLFLSAVLLFLVELIMAKMILPLLGGSPSVWNTCMVFYQAALLAGYAYAHASSTWLSLRHQLLLHIALVVVPIISLPLGITTDWVPPTEGSPVLWLLALLLVSVGLPFFILSSSTPLLQKWFSSTGHPAAKDPYFLYAASNLGSMLALLSYPTVVEPLLPVKKGYWLTQCWLWTIGYGVLIALVIGCAWIIGKALDRGEKLEPDRTGPGERGYSTAPKLGALTQPRSPIGALTQPTTPSPRPGIVMRLRWVALAFVPSSLMLGVTTYITMDLAAIPLFWVIPLALYLLSFILVFAKWPRRLHNAVLFALPPLLLLLVFLIQGEMKPANGLVIFLHLLVLFLVALACHGELALSRPAPRYLTEFYLLLSVGGVLGGIFNALVAPAVFHGIAEYQVALAFACLLLPGRAEETPAWITRWVPARLAKPACVLADVALAVLVGFVTFKLFQFFVIRHTDFAWVAGLRDQLRTNYFVQAGKWLGIPSVAVGSIILFGLPLLFCYALAARPLRFLLGLVGRLGLSSQRLLARREPLIHYLFVRRPLVLGLGVGAFMYVGYFWRQVGQMERPLYQGRNFYGVLKVTRASDAGIAQLRLTNGTTSHGVQWDIMAVYFTPLPLFPPAPVILDVMRLRNWAELNRQPLSYYHRTGPIGQVFAEFSGPKAKKNVGVIGLGTGTLASYGEPGQSFTFFEIDPAVVDVAGRYFAYLMTCRAKWQIILGDARLRLNLAEDKQFQLLIVDAFNSDAIPVHLLTREALELYFQKLSEDGLLALHISNRYLSLEPVLGNLAEDLHLAGVAEYDSDFLRYPGKRASQWVLLARRRKDFGNLTRDPRWKPLQRRPEVGVWTDDYSNLLGVFKWN